MWKSEHQQFNFSQEKKETKKSKKQKRDKEAVNSIETTKQDGYYT